ncbi:hypothetical protein [Pseudomonas phage D6]|nr:hypothetical protein [Pseudomonas phage D6]
MERNYFKEKLPEFRTPMAHAGISRLDDTDRHVTMWACSFDNSMDQSKWFFAVKVGHCDKQDIANVFQEEVHFFTDQIDAWLFRANALGSKLVHFTDYQHTIDANGDMRKVGIITEPDFRARSLWDGYVYEEIKNLKG